jgi:uncharacterized protein YcaQ
MRQLSLSDARTLHLAAQGLLAPPKRRPTSADLLAAIRRMALLQIDTISVVARSPYFVLWSRLGAYDPAWLDALLAEGALFEYWAHEACFVPIEDYGLLRHRMLDPARMGWKYSVQWMRTHRREIDAVLHRIRREGPLRAADFERTDKKKSDGWWDWKPAKRHLEVLFTAGELMVRERRGFQRVYDLRERVLPDWDDARDLPTPEAAQTEMIRRSCRALGIVRADWVADYYRLRREKYAATLGRLAEAGELLPVNVEGWRQAAFVHADLAPQLEDIASDSLKPTLTTLLSPFDPVVWDRKRARELFAFDYRIECYTPAHKRVHGYFVLPILSRGKLVGRLDAKAHRREGVFEIKALHLEAGVKPRARLTNEVSASLRRCAAWHGTPKLVVQASDLPLERVA